MFDFSKWLVSGIVEGYKKGETPFSKVTELTAAYYSKGLISEKQTEEIATLCPAPITETDTTEIEEVEE